MLLPESTAKPQELFPGAPVLTDPGLKPPPPTTGSHRRGRGVCEAKRIGASTFLCRQKGLTDFPPQPRPKTRPPSPLSMARLCAFADLPASDGPDLPAEAHSIATGSRSHQKPARTGEAGGSARQSASEPLPFSVYRKASRTFRPNPDRRPGLPLHYRWRDYAPLPTCPPRTGQTSLQKPIQSRLEAAPTKNRLAPARQGGLCMMGAKKGKGTAVHP
jgi:hypothetical protein